MSFILFHVIIFTLRVDTSNISLQELSESSQLEKEIIFVGESRIRNISTASIGQIKQYLN